MRRYIRQLWAYTPRKSSTSGAIDVLPHCNLNSASTLPTKTAFILSLHMMPFPKPVFVCLCGRFVVGLPVSYDTGSLKSPGRPRSSTHTWQSNPLRSFLMLPPVHFHFLAQVFFKRQIWSCRSLYLKLFSSLFFPVLEVFFFSFLIALLFFLILWCILGPW